MVSKMVIDLHIHTKGLSPCSEMDAEEAVLEAKRIGLDGICFTEHNKPWPDNENTIHHLPHACLKVKIKI